ncbi:MULTISPECIES: acyl-CoA dehydrogenase family protein [unclassified Mycobacterium]|uniref:acyl-CoA dehydrogenase family protein n=1 Tax=unclassified Mycobacterium TaxID=2642494 RepID=UPI00073FDBBD|nr:MULTISPECIES: acyl-CoA dehydrogenase family protein [unclassified Mycobacterium]KUH83126.1 acyl-CoA dehydrogenase [Mycobacterium sp. GA-0227b]KUH84464.1 acyl-CoA dehydrogenase [Mycobacterium sp. GA-1999]KUH89400.1 acyl-CoA dehydrogenase [Mycobacterium sp. IS-1556]
MLRWSDEQLMYRKAVRRFVETVVAPQREALEFDGVPPFDILRKFYAEFGVADSAMERFAATMAGQKPPRNASEKLIPLLEFSRHSPGLVTALGASIDLTAGAILRSGSDEQKRRWVPDLLSLAKIGAWALTEPESGSDAFGAMRCTARATEGGWLLNGSKTFISNAPYADTIVFICKLDDGRPAAQRKIMTFVLEKGMPGLWQSEPLRKMGLHSSPTGELRLDNVFVTPDRLLDGPGPNTGPAKSAEPSGSAAKATFAMERASMAANALGIIERCLELSVDYSKTRVQFGKPIGDYQLIQLKLAKMEVARLNTENLLLQYIAMSDAGLRPSLAEASAIKLYTAQAAMEVALEAVQIFGGNGYMAENHVEQLCRDAKILSIFGGTDEIQVRTIARSLLAEAQ